MSKDKPFRELQFSSAQLIFVFLGILVLGVFIFLLGISVGKKQAVLTAGAGAPPTAKTEALAPKTPVPADSGSGARGGQVVGGAPETTNPSATAAPPAKPETPPAAKPEDAKPAATAAAKPAAKPKPAETKASETKPTEAAAKPAETKPAVEAEKKPAAKGRFFVQVGAVADKPSAQSFADRVEKLGFTTTVLDPQATDKKQVYRVRVGPYETMAEADDAQDKVATALKKKKADFFIVKD